MVVNNHETFMVSQPKAWPITVDRRSQALVNRCIAISAPAPGVTPGRADGVG